MDELIRREHYRQVDDDDMDEPKHMYWAYRHVNGNISLKRYWSEDSMSDARVSPFVQSVMEPFEAASRAEAEQKARDFFRS